MQLSESQRREIEDNDVNVGSYEKDSFYGFDLSRASNNGTYRHITVSSPVYSSAGVAIEKGVTFVETVRKSSKFCSA